LPQTSPGRGRRRPPPTRPPSGRKVGSGPPLPGRLPAPLWCLAADDAGTTALGPAAGTAEVPSTSHQTPPRLPTTTARPSARPGLDGPSEPEAAAAAAGAPPPRGGNTSTVGASTRSSWASRDATPPDRRRRPRLRRQGRWTAAARGREPRHHRRRQGFVRWVLRQRRRGKGRGRRREGAGGWGAPRVA
jgi:hypothetical protein